MSSLFSIFGRKSEPVKIQSSLTVDECANVLKKATVTGSAFKTMFADTGAILCNFNGNKFQLRQKKSYRNSFAPLFYGEFRPSLNGTEIEGEFRMQPFVIAFMALWFGMLLIIGGTMIFASLGQLVTGHYDHTRNANPVVGVVGPLAMMVFGIAFVKFGKWLARSEEAYITHFLKETFSINKASPSTASVAPSPLPDDSMRIAILVFALVGVISIGFSFAGISSYQATASSGDVSRSGMTITYYHDAWERSLGLVSGIALCFMAYGIWKRIYITWMLGFVLIVLSAINFILNVWTNSGIHQANSPPFPVQVFMGIASLAMGAYWWFWWYKKKIYFTKNS